MSDVDLEEILERFCAENCPAVLCDPELFTRLLHFTHRLLREAVRHERRETLRRALRPSPS